MKKIKYQMLQTTIIDDVEQFMSEEYMSSVILPWSEQNEEIAKHEAYKGEYEVFEDAIPEPVVEPTQVDRIEAQVTYTAMMTDTLLGV